MKYKIDKPMLEHQMNVRELTNEELIKSCKLIKKSIKSIKSNEELSLMTIVKISRFLNINLYHLITI